jgi:hypothetical protein
MDNKSFNGEQKIKLTQIINEGMQVMHEIDTLQGGLTDTIKAIAEEIRNQTGCAEKSHSRGTQGRVWQDQTRSRTVGNNS